MASGAARRQRLKEAGLCSQCTDPPVPGQSRCRKHLDKANAAARRRNSERKAFGLCIRCPNKLVEKHVLCQSCLDGLRARDINWDGKRAKEKTQQQIRMAAGLCKWCDNPNFEGRALCEEHLKIEREKVRAYRAERKAKGLCWRCDDPARAGGVLCQKHRDEVTAKERAKSVTRAGTPTAGEVKAQVHPTSVVRENGPSSEEDAGGQTMVTIKNDGLRVDATVVAEVVDGDGVERPSGAKLLVEEPDPADMPIFLHDPRLVGKVLLHRYVA